MNRRAADPERLARDLLGRELAELDTEEQEVIQRVAAGCYLGIDAAEAQQLEASFGDRMADRVAAIGGSWGFIAAFMLIMAAWMAANVSHFMGVDFDPFPFILLNLTLSTVAALQAPIILMSQNRQSKKDRITARHDYEVNLRTQLEIVRLSRKLDRMMHVAIREAKKAEETIDDVVDAVRNGK
ncbi:hypothetical protein A6F68_02736 [Tsuneonella dongtanensis]|uniref:DUF1003 domain-containing protein n=1 Tax=Tsuneonella dongtanensis TaxID=692370 RepID=A0A1B2AGG5_9SPHN|nr:DUF1003 domain-containing protein [Tsuneonella dongtanensis]ANY21226.1 hypothetical protein A6F68_02736 [Tsuneonella dongtanensis]